MAQLRLLAWILAASLCVTATPAIKTEQQLKKIGALADRGLLDDAEAALDALERREPTNPQVTVVRELLKQKRAATLIKQGDAAVALGNRQVTQEQYAKAYLLDPQNEYARSRFADAGQRSAKKVEVVDLAEEPRLQPKPGLHNSEFRGDSRGLIDAFAKEFGLRAE